MRRKKSILFIRPDYHCSFFYRNELRRLGWKADIFLNPGYPGKLLYSDDVLRAPQVPGTRCTPIKWLNRVLALFWWLATFWRYQFHFYYGRPPQFSFLEDRFCATRLFGAGFLVELWLAKLFRIKLLYLPTGCHDDESKANWALFDDGNVCRNCGLYDRCNDESNILNFSRIRRYFDLAVGFGVKDSTQFKETHIKYKAIDLELWHPALRIPPEHTLPPSDCIRVLHSAMLNSSGRNWQERNIKGSRFVQAAIERLKQEGYRVEYFFVEDKPSNQMRFYQAQADIVVEQLIYGWWGSTGVETMALGKPVVCYIRPSWKTFFLRIFPEYDNLPIVEADTTTIYDVLKRLLTDTAYRQRKGEESRRFAETHFNPEHNAKAFAALLETL